MNGLSKDKLKRLRPLMKAVYACRRSTQIVQNINVRAVRLTKDVHIADRDSYIYLHWSRSANFGDQLSRLVTGALSGKSVVTTETVPNITFRPVFSCIGSVLQFAHFGPLEIWGSGFIYGSGRFVFSPRRVHAVRGELTRKICLNQGVRCPAIYGDPAVLAFDQFASYPRSQEFPLGVIPHYADAGHEAVAKLKDTPDVLVIDVLRDWRAVAKDVARCRAIASSSLHGLILADSMLVPNRWLGISDLVMKDRFKFLDYFSSIGRAEDPLMIDDFSPGKAIKEAHLRHKAFSRDALLASCPFRENGFEERLRQMACAEHVQHERERQESIA